MKKKARKSKKKKMSIDKKYADVIISPPLQRWYSTSYFRTAKEESVTALIFNSGLVLFIKHLAASSKQFLCSVFKYKQLFGLN